MGLDFFIGHILQADGAWEWDDTNHTDLPIGTIDLTNSTEKYTFATDFLQILGMEILDSDGSTYRKIYQLDREDLGDLTVDEYFTTKGIPEYYDIIGDSIYLYPAPDSTLVTVTAGLKVYSKRNPDYLTASDTTQEPGIQPALHPGLCHYIARSYNAKYHPERVAENQRMIDEAVRLIPEIYGDRNKDRKHFFSNRPLVFK